MILNLDLKYKGRKEKNAEGKELNDEELTSNLLYTMVNIKYTDTNPRTGNPISNMTRKEGRLWGRISEKLEDMLIEKKKEVDLTKEEYNFLFALINDDDIKLHPSSQRYYNAISDYINSLKVEVDKK